MAAILSAAVVVALNRFNRRREALEAARESRLTGVRLAALPVHATVVFWRPT